ncbi:MAG: acyl-ACP desaturase [Alphaproteobacteria bacterium]|nr:acyl-ACP desaturase [Alphaproteobacteria bacterium]
MSVKHWTLDDIPWHRFDPSKINPDIINVIKAASVVEANGKDYGLYLCNVFHDDPEFQDVAKKWAIEEVQHGEALAKWAHMADPDFIFDQSFDKFIKGYQIPVTQTQSVRGSRCGELVARCIVETGTSSYYTALMESTEEPVLKEICRRIAADELRHYKLFYSYLNKYLEKERIGTLKRLSIALTRIFESEDDELAYAYYATNEKNNAIYQRAYYTEAYAKRAYSFYQTHHIDKVMAMVFKAIGLKPYGWIYKICKPIAHTLFHYRSWKAARS